MQKMLTDLIANHDRRQAGMAIMAQNILAPIRYVSNPTHLELIEICRQSLILEGNRPDLIRREYPIKIGDRTYVADLVVLNPESKYPSVVVECGKLSDPVKIQVLSSIFQRFIWVPYMKIAKVPDPSIFIDAVSELMKHHRKAAIVIEEAMLLLKKQEIDVERKIKRLEKLKSSLEATGMVIINDELLEQAIDKAGVIVQPVVPLVSSQNTPEPSSPN